MCKNHKKSPSTAQNCCYSYSHNMTRTICKTMKEDIFSNPKCFFFCLFLQMSVSNATHVTLRNVGFNLSGNFTCEVTADAPSFYTALATNILTVVGKYCAIELLNFFKLFSSVEKCSDLLRRHPHRECFSNY